MRRFAIINPAAGNGTTGRSLKTILRHLENVVDGYAVSEFPGHCQELAAGNPSAEVLVGVGGDGTVGEVVNGMNCSRQRLAIVPTGTGNSLARDMGVTSLEAASARAASATSRTIDLLRIVYTSSDGSTVTRLCTSTASIGYAANVTDLANRQLKKLGPLCYPLASFYCALGNKRIEMALSVDGGSASPVVRTGIIVQNVRFAANFELFPGARYDDGLMDVMEIDAGFFGQSLHNISVLTHRYFYRARAVRIATAVTFQMRRPQLLMIDGEIQRDVTSVSIEVQPGMLRCCR